MPSIITGPMAWHDGEKKMHSLLHIPLPDNPTNPFLTPRIHMYLQTFPLMAIGAVDREGKPWTTIWGGEVGFATPTAEGYVQINTPVDGKYDPLVDVLLQDSPKDQSTKRLLSGLVIDLESRRRGKLHGRQISGSIASVDGDDAAEEHTGIANMAVHIDASLGNCPKYINIRHIVPALPDPRLVSDSPQLPPDAISFLDRVDTLFISSSNGTVDMDTNIRGGPPGFVRVVSNEPSGAVFVYPEYSGNRLYQTLGNLQVTPLAGYVFPDFETGNALFATGTVEILVGKNAAAVLPRSNLAVRVTVTAARYVERTLAFRGIAGDPSPYNPSVRYLASEKAIPTIDEGPSITATLVRKEIITPNIGRFRFRMSDPKQMGPWTPGQYATFSFEEELSTGYHHMQDDDPSSLNDDYVRTFTVSSYPGKYLPPDEFEITARRHGNVTRHLFQTSERAGMEVPLKGFGGDFAISSQGGQDIFPFIAGGIGITPVIAQLPGIDISRLRLFWSMHTDDIGLVVDTFQRFPQLPQSTKLFLTGPDPQDEEAVQQLEAIKGTEVQVERHRMHAADLDLLLADVWYFCGSPALKGSVMDWLTGETVVYEDFNY
ncbi:putative oxidoreductase, FAD-binding [Aspergillus affinis]|uniref:putative oxidoreductase, FAD-binding n=1 Tax=Aspergillus affinis TaxID=1070780 RepID=UPI0022FEC7ED|nr:uncharacterized protein KD926_004115 [Aspergillus affinis]KAI9046277.1 hypothetical protein KD926_004115 [Aspergillus affinis]